MMMWIRAAITPPVGVHHDSLYARPSCGVLAQLINTLARLHKTASRAYAPGVGVQALVRWRGLLMERTMATIQPGDREDMRRAAVNAMHEHWVLFLIEGIV